VFIGALNPFPPPPTSPPSAVSVISLHVLKVHPCLRLHTAKPIHQLCPSAGFWADSTFSYGVSAGYFPLTMKEVRSLPFWINAWQLWGSIGFLISAAAPYKLDITWKGEVIELIFGSLIGSIWFWLNGWGLYLELANPHVD